MKRIVLPGHGTPTIFTVAEDSTIGILANGKLLDIKLKAGSTRIEFVNNLAVGLGIAA